MIKCAVKTYHNSVEQGSTEEKGGRRRCFDLYKSGNSYHLNCSVGLERWKYKYKRKGRSKKERKRERERERKMWLAQKIERNWNESRSNDGDEDEEEKENIEKKDRNRDCDMISGQSYKALYDNNLRLYSHTD